MPTWSRYAVVCGFLAVLGVQFLLARQLSGFAVASAERNASMISGLAETTRRVDGFKDAFDSLSDQLNTVGRDAFDPQRHTRGLLRQMRQIGRPFIVVIGDSITQRAPLPETICGYPLINAGISGSRTSNFIPFAEEMARLSPALIVVALGVNDSSRNLKTSFKNSYRALLDSLPKVPTVLASLAPVDFSGVDGKTIDPRLIDLVDREIRSVAVWREFPLIELAGLRQFQTIDGVHPTVDGNASWVAAIVGGIKSALSCS